MPHPLPFVEVRDPDVIHKVRRINCESYFKCLSHAEQNDWDGFHCNGCEDFSPRDQREDYAGCEIVLRELAEIAPFHLPDKVVILMLKRKGGF